MNVSLFSLRPKGRLRRSSTSDIPYEDDDDNEEVVSKRSKSKSARGGVFRSFSGAGSSSEHTGITMIDPISDEDLTKKKKEPSRRKLKKNKKKKGISKLFCVTKIGSSKPRDPEQDQQKPSSYELTESPSQDYSQEDISDWVRAQRELKAKSEQTLKTASTSTTNKVVKKSKPKTTKSKSSKQTKTEEAPSKDETPKEPEQEPPVTTTPVKPPSFLVLDESMKLSNSTLLSTPEFFEATADELKDDEESVEPATKPVENPKGSQSFRSVSTTSSRRSRPRSALDITGHTSTSMDEESSPQKTSSQKTCPQKMSAQKTSPQKTSPQKTSPQKTSPQKTSPPLQRTSKRDLHKSRTKKKTTKPKEGSSSTLQVDTAAEAAPINPLRQYPSKKRQRKKSRHSATLRKKAPAAASVDFTGSVSPSETTAVLRKGTGPSIVREIHRLNSVVDVMMTRMDLYEEQSDCLVQASLAYNAEWKKKNLGVGSQEMTTTTTKDPGNKQEFMANSTVPTKESSVNEWITKLEGIQEGYHKKMAETKDQLKVLQEIQAITNKKLIRGYEQRLQGKHAPPKGEGEATTRSRSNRTQRSISQRTRSSRKRSSMSRSNRSAVSLSNRSLLSRSTDEESSMWDSGIIDTAVDIENSCHTATSTRSVTFNPTVNVATTLSRHDMCPNEKFHYWAADGDDEMTEEVLEQLSQRWSVRNLIDDVEQELSSHSRTADEWLPSKLISEEIKKLLPATEREGNEGYTYTIGIQE